MNKRQLVTLWIGIGLFVLMGIFPPWLRTGFKTIFGAGRYTAAAGYAPIFLPPAYALSVDASRLFLQWGIVALVTGGFIVTFRKPKA